MPTTRVTTTRVFTRPSISVPWYHETPEAASASTTFNNHLKFAYYDTGKLIDRIFSAAPLTYTVTIEWDSVESVNEHYSDPVTLEHFARRDAYNAANGITTTLTQS